MEILLIIGNLIKTIALFVIVFLSSCRAQESQYELYFSRVSHVRLEYFDKLFLPNSEELGRKAVCKLSIEEADVNLILSSVKSYPLDAHINNKSILVKINKDKQTILILSGWELATVSDGDVHKVDGSYFSELIQKIDSIAEEQGCIL